MDGFEKLIKVIRSEANRNRDAYPVKLGYMKENNCCMAAGLELEPEDLMVAEHLEGKLEKDDVVLVVQISEGMFAIIERVVEM